jgi:rubrerythrin
MRSRRDLLSAAAGAGAAAALAACGGSDDDDKPQPAGADAAGRRSADLEILGFALTLEHVLASFYERVVAANVLQGEPAALARQFAGAEREHVTVLEGLVRRLRGRPARAPRTRFEAAFDAGPAEVLRTAATLENLAAAAYLGQANRVQDPRILAQLVAIHSVEARHAAAVNVAAGLALSGPGRLQGAIPDGSFAEPMDADEVQARLKRYLA